MPAAFHFSCCVICHFALWNCVKCNTLCAQDNFSSLIRHGGADVMYCICTASLWQAGAIYLQNCFCLLIFRKYMYVHRNYIVSMLINEIPLLYYLSFFVFVFYTLWQHSAAYDHSHTATKLSMKYSYVKN